MTGERVRSTEQQIETYVERVTKVAKEKPGLLREQVLYHKFLTKPEDITDDYIRGILLGNFAEQKGYERDQLNNPELKSQIKELFTKQTGQDPETFQIPKEQRRELIEQTIHDQRSSLDRWFEYLTGPEAEHYPDVFKYWAFAEMLKLGSYDAERKTFNKRTKDTAAPFPELNQQALALTLDEISRKLKQEPSHITDLDPEQQKTFRRRQQGENFGKLYGFMLEHVNKLKLPEERMPITTGEWRKFSRGSSAKELTKAIESFNTQWCIAGEGTAASYLAKQDIWIYFSEDKDNQNTIPRAALVTDGKTITEVRGILAGKNQKQHLDSYIAPLVSDKLKELPGGEAWQIQMQDQKQIAQIHLKSLQGEQLNKTDLRFLYELDSPIQSTGYGKDPRIDELRQGRDTEADMLVVFEATKEQIAHNAKEIRSDTKAYVGKLEPGIFKLLAMHPQIEHIYTSFPERPIRLEHLEVGGKTAEQYIQEIEHTVDSSGKQMYITDWARSMLQNKKEFRPSETPQELDLVRLSVADLMTPDEKQRGYLTTQELFARAAEYGLELAPAETGPELRLKLKDQPIGEYLYVAHQPITGRVGPPAVFRVARAPTSRGSTTALPSLSTSGIPTVRLSSVSASSFFNT